MTEPGQPAARPPARPGRAEQPRYGAQPGRWGIFAIFAVGLVLAFFARYATAVLVDDLKRSFGIGSAGIGLLASAYFWPYALMQPPAGVLADTIGPRRAAAGFLLLAATGLTIFSLAGSLPLAIFGRALGGFGAGIVYVCALRIFANWFRLESFATVTGLFNAIGNAGGLLAAGPFAAVLQSVGWRAAFLTVAALTLLLAALIWLAVRDAPADQARTSAAPGAFDREQQGALARRDTHPDPNGERAAYREQRHAAIAPAGRWYAGIGAVLRQPNFWLLGTYAAVTLGITAVVQGLWMVPFLRDAFGLSKQHAANLVTLWAVGLTAGVFLWAIIAGRLLHGSRRALLLSLVLCAGVFTPFALFGGRLPEWSLPCLLLGGGFATACWTPAYAQMRASVPPALTGTAIGLLNFAFFAGAALAQQLSSLALAGRTGAGADGPYRALFAAFVAAAGLAFVAVWWSRDQTPVRGSRAG